MNTKLFSIKYRVLSYVFALLVPMTLMLGILAIIQIRDAQSQLAESEKMNLHMIVSQLENETSEIEKFLYNLVLDDNTIRSMSDKQSETQLYAGTYDLQLIFGNQFKYNWDSNFLILYSASNEYYFAKDNGLDGLPVQDRIYLCETVKKRFTRFFLDSNPNLGGWYTEKIGGRTFLCRITYKHGMYCAAAISLDILVQSLEKYYGLTSALVFRDGNALLTELHAETASAADDWAENRYGFTQIGKSQKYMAVSEEICGITLSYIVPYHGMMSIMSWPLTLLVVIAIISGVSLPVTYLYLKRNFFEPLDGLVDTMDYISEGNMEVTADDNFRFKEFRRVNQTFNQMISQITKLKIERYEKELEVKQVKLQFLQAQIRPHFYLNCLKNLYSLAEQKHYDAVKESILLLSNHLRYVFRQQGETIALREEIRLCDNYIKLYELQSENAPQLILDMDNTVMDVPIPPVSVLTFVENSIRYGYRPNQELKISITAHRLCTEDGDVLCLTVRDNGIGFTEEQLIWFNGSGWYETATEGVGIQNVVKRFLLLYGDDFTIAFFNRDGALQELYIPINTEYGKENADETIDR